MTVLTFLGEVAGSVLLIGLLVGGCLHDHLRGDR